MFAAFVLVYIYFIIIDEINRDNIDCNSYLGGTCSGKEIHCADNEECIISCSSDGVCSGASLNCARDYQCTINIINNAQNMFPNINGAENSPLTVNVMMELIFVLQQYDVLKVHYVKLIVFVVILEILVHVSEHTQCKM